MSDHLEDQKYLKTLQTSTHGPDKIKRLEFLDSVRGLAAFWVMLKHTIIYLGWDLKVKLPVWSQLSWFGDMGVDLFFVASAFSLCYTMGRHKDNSTAAFYTRRFFRIAPLFYVMILFGLWENFHQPSIVQRSLISATFLFNIVPGQQPSTVGGGWSVGVEMIFYLMFPFIFPHITNINRAIVLLLGCILLTWPAGLFMTYLNHAVLHDATFPSFDSIFFVHFLPSFAAGIFAFHLGSMLQKRGNSYLIGTLLLGAAFIALYYFCRRWGADELGRVFNQSSITQQALIFALFIVALMLAPVRLFVNPVTSFLGKLSYSLYLVHIAAGYYLKPVYAAIYAHGFQSSLQFLACVMTQLAVVVPISMATFEWIESPGIRYGAILRSRLLAPKLRSVPT